MLSGVNAFFTVRDKTYTVLSLHTTSLFCADLYPWLFRPIRFGEY